MIIETGMPPAELDSLTRRQVSFEKGFLQIEDSKTESSNRKIRLSDKAAEVLRLRLARFKGEYLFPKSNIDGEGPPYQLNDQHRTTIDRLGLKFRICDLRHALAMRILERGKTGLLTLASMLGHSILDQVLRYAHPSGQRKAEAIQKRTDKSIQKLNFWIHRKILRLFVACK